MKRATYIGAALTVLALYQTTAVARDFKIEVGAGTTGAFKATDGEHSYKGDFTRLPNGFIRLNDGTVRYAMEIPQFGIVSQAFGSGEEGFVAAVDKGACPTKKWEGTFVFSSWDVKNDVSKAEQPVFGTFAWEPKSHSLTVAELYNLTDYKVLAGFKPFSVPGECKDGMITFKGEGDRGGVVTLTRNQGGLYVSNSGKRMVVFPKSKIPGFSRMEGLYSVLNYRGMSGETAEPGAATLSATGATAQRLSGKENLWFFSRIQLNMPVEGVFTADLTTKPGGTANHAACAVTTGTSTFVFCTSADSEHPKNPLHFAMRLSASQLAKNGR